MANDINQVVLVGRLTRDPELRTLPSGASLCQLGIASNENYKDGDEWKERANFIDVTVWGRQAESCAEYLSKGRQVCIHGNLRYRSWTNDNGDKRSKLEVNARQVQFLSDGSGGKKHTDDDVPYDDEPVAATAGADDDDIPF